MTCTCNTIRTVLIINAYSKAKTESSNWSAIFRELLVGEKKQGRSVNVFSSAFAKLCERMTDIPVTGFECFWTGNWKWRQNSFWLAHFEFHFQKNKGGTAHSRPFPVDGEGLFVFARIEEVKCHESPTKNCLCLWKQIRYFCLFTSCFLKRSGRFR